MRLIELHKSKLTTRQLNAIIAEIQPWLKELTFARAVYRQMKRFEYGDDPAIFSQITREMRGRSATARSKSNYNIPYKVRVQRAAKYAKETYDAALYGSPDIDDVSEFDIIQQSAAKFGVRYQDLIK